MLVPQLALLVEAVLICRLIKSTARRQNSSDNDSETASIGSRSRKHTGRKPKLFCVLDELDSFMDGGEAESFVT